MIRYHWVLTLGGTVAGAQVTSGNDGTVDLLPGDSRVVVRREVESRVLASIRERTGHEMRNVCTLFWSLEPDELP